MHSTTGGKRFDYSFKVAYLLYKLLPLNDLMKRLESNGVLGLAVSLNRLYKADDNTGKLTEKRWKYGLKTYRFWPRIIIL